MLKIKLSKSNGLLDINNQHLVNGFFHKLQYSEYYAKKQYEDLTEFLSIGLLLNAKNQNSKMGDFTIGMAASVRCIKN